MSRQRNTNKESKDGVESYVVSEVDERSLNKGDDFWTSLLSDRYSVSDVLENTLTVVVILLRTLYSAMPFIIIAYMWDIYRTPNDQLYHPDFPNSHHSSTSAEFDDMNVEFYDLADHRSTANGWQNSERILFLVPLRDASSHLPMFFGHMRNMTYPHNLIDMSFLISDTSDNTLEDLKMFLSEFQNDPDKSQRFGRIEIYEKDFGQVVGQSFSDRHGFAAQGPRRKLMAIARNWLLTTALRPDHSWVYWRDIDVETSPATILEDLMHHDRDVIVPNIWRPLPDWLGYEQAYDLNSWQESEGGIELAERLDEDAVIVEGYPEYATWRPHLAYLRDPYGDPEVEMELDGIGGVSILARASVFRRGAMFPAFSFKKHAETEAFGKLCKTMGFEVVGLPHYVIWHIYEPSTDDLKHMEWLANEELRQKELLKNKEFYDRAWELAFEDVNEKWQAEKFNVFKNNDLSRLGIGQAHWDEVDEYLTEVEDGELDEEIKGPRDDSFMWDFNDRENQKLEKSVLEKLRTGPKKYGQNKHEFIYGDFNRLDGGTSNRRKAFKKFENPYFPQDDEVVDSNLEGTYDLNSDRVDQSKFSGISDVTENVLIQDKELFSELEQGKVEADEEEEGEVEFKEQMPIEEATKKKPTTHKKTTIRTLYEVDDEGATIATVLHTVVKTVTPTPTATAKATKAKAKVAAKADAEKAEEGTEEGTKEDAEEDVEEHFEEEEIVEQEEVVDEEDAESAQAKATNSKSAKAKAAKGEAKAQAEADAFDVAQEQEEDSKDVRDSTDEEMQLIQEEPELVE